MGPNDDHRPEDFSDVERRLREHRDEPTGIELDAMKMRATRGSSSARRGVGLRSKLATGFLTGALMLSSTSAVVVASGRSDDSSKNRGNDKNKPKPKPKPKPPKGGGHGQYCPPPRHGNDSDCNNGDGHGSDRSDNSSDNSSDSSD